MTQTLPQQDLSDMPGEYRAPRAVPPYRGDSPGAGAAKGFFAWFGVAVVPSFAAIAHIGNEALKDAARSSSRTLELSKNKAVAITVAIAAPVVLGVLGAISGHNKASHAARQHDALKDEVARAREVLAHARSKRKEAQQHYELTDNEHVHARHRMNASSRQELPTATMHEGRYHEAAQAHHQARQAHGHAENHHDYAEAAHADAEHALAMAGHGLDSPHDSWASRIEAEHAARGFDGPSM